MPKILIRNLNNKLIDVPTSNDSILKIIHDHQIDCLLVVPKGGAHLAVWSFIQARSTFLLLMRPSKS